MRDLRAARAGDRRVRPVVLDDEAVSRLRFGNGIFPYWAGASTVLLAGKPTPEVVLETIKRFEPTLFFSAPTLYNAILNYLHAGDYELLHPLRCLGGGGAARPRLAPLEGDVRRDHSGRYRLDRDATSLSPTPRTGSNRGPGNPVPATRPESSTRKSTPWRSPTRPDTSPSRATAAAYYWRNHEKTKETMKGEWLFAGDWYRVDEDGFYWYEGRADDMTR